jgi:hypothetical protein
MIEQKDGRFLLTEPYECAIMRTIGKLLKTRKSTGDFADWRLLINCTDNGSKIETEIVSLKEFPKMKVTAR